MKPSNVWESRKNDQRVSGNADQAEFLAVKLGSTPIDFGVFDDQIADSLDDYEAVEATDAPEWFSRDLTVESAISDIGGEIARRRDILGDLYPFDFVANSVRYCESNSLVYEFCLAVSLSKLTGEFSELPEAFERLCKDIVIAWAGPGSNGIRTGAPRRKEQGEPVRFKEVCDLIYCATHEWKWNPREPMPDDPDPRHVKDSGVDVVVWKLLGDKRIGNLFFIGQCACGNDYSSKYSDSSVEKVSRWFHPMTYVKPVRFFAVPRHIGNIVELGEISEEAGLTLDRVRLTLLGDKQDAVLEHRETLRRLVDLVLNRHES
jgi:hypothetical protein